MLIQPLSLKSTLDRVEVVVLPRSPKEYSVRCRWRWYYMCIHVWHHGLNCSCQSPRGYGHQPNRSECIKYPILTGRMLILLISTYRDDHSTIFGEFWMVISGWTGLPSAMISTVCRKRIRWIRESHCCHFLFQIHPLSGVIQFTESSIIKILVREQRWMKWKTFSKRNAWKCWYFSCFYLNLTTCVFVRRFLPGSPGEPHVPDRIGSEARKLFVVD